MGRAKKTRLERVFFCETHRFTVREVMGFGNARKKERALPLPILLRTVYPKRAGA